MGKAGWGSLTALFPLLDKESLSPSPCAEMLRLDPVDPLIGGIHWEEVARRGIPACVLFSNSLF